MFSTLIRTHAESRNLDHRTEGAGFECSECWHHKPVKSNGGTGYGFDSSGRLYCYECCAKRDREEMKDQSKPFSAYVNGKGDRVTSWAGGELGKIFAYAESRTGWNRGTIARFHVLDCNGNWWQGRGPGRGMYCTLRAMKKPAYAKSWGK